MGGGSSSEGRRKGGWVPTRCFQTADMAVLACGLRSRGVVVCGRTHVLKAEELVAAVGAQRPGVGQQLLQRRWLGRVGVLLRDRVASGWAGRGLQRRQYEPLRGGRGGPQRHSQRPT